MNDDHLPTPEGPQIPENNADLEPESDSEPEEESFAELLESYSSGMSDDIRVGEKVRVKIISISDSAVFVNAGTKADGIVETEELKDEEGNLAYAVGDELELFVVAADESEIRLSKAISGIGGLTLLQEAYDNKIPVEGKVIQTIKGGFQVEVLKRRAFCPISQMDVHYVEDPEPYVGQTYQFRIKTLAEQGRNIVLSRRVLLEKEQQKARKEFLKTLEPEQILTGRVTRLMPFGAFVELAPGLEGLVHISELSWSRLEKTEDAVSPGDRLDVKVLRQEGEGKQLKIALSAKQVSGNPWERVADEFQAGQKVTGKVTRNAPFGAFVEIRPGVEGLVHISEMSYARRINTPDEIVEPGQTIAVMIKEIDSAKRRISLSIRDAEGDPWLDVSDKFIVGQKVKATVEHRAQFGLFITLTPGIVGLLPKSVIKQNPQAARIETLKPGDPIEVMVAGINAPERKISLNLGQGEDESNWREYSQETQVKTDAAPLGDLGAKLAAALNQSTKEDL
ncbi:MAG: 30S ribosomal protein S1 [Desulfobacterales bacterium]|jgi:small subunit ribosomal protein S1